MLYCFDQVFREAQMKNSKHFLLTFIFFASLGQFAADIYLPSLPFIVDEFHTSLGLVQFSIAIFMLGFALSSLIYRPVSDVIGRKKPLMMGLLLCFIGTLICISSRSIVPFLIGRFVQGLGAAAGAIILGAVVRDILSEVELVGFGSSRVISNLAAMMIAPLVGGYLEAYFNWRESFIVIAVYAGLALVVSVLAISETNKNRDRRIVKTVLSRSNLMVLLTSKTFLTYSFCIFMVYGGVLAWLASGSMLLQKIVGLTPLEFGWVACLSGLAYALGVIINSASLEKFGANGMIMVGACLLLFAGICSLIFGLFHFINLDSIVFPVMLFMVGAGIIFPNAYAGAVTPFANCVGLAMSLFGAIQAMGGFVFSAIISFLPVLSSVPMSIMFVISGVATGVLIVTIKRSSKSFPLSNRF